MAFGFRIEAGQTRPTFYLDDISLKAQPAPTSVNVNVNAASVIRTVDARHFGVNAVIWDGVFDTATTINLLTEMDNKTLRFPGGSLSDEYHWESNTTLNNNWQWATSFDKFAHVASNTHAQVFITVNYGTGTPTEAANWVRNANVTKGLGVRYWEIGNENYGTWETDSNPRPHDPYTYAVRFKDYWTQMKPSIPRSKSAQSSSRVKTATRTTRIIRRSIRARANRTTVGRPSCSRRCAVLGCDARLRGVSPLPASAGRGERRRLASDFQFVGQRRGGLCASNSTIISALGGTAWK
jgi:hypothetical protein